MKTFLILCLAAFATAANYHRVQNRRVLYPHLPVDNLHRHFGRIVGGNEADDGEYPWAVALYFNAGYFCTGSILSENTVLTAGHCTDGGASSVDVIIGTNNQQSGADAIEITGSRLMTHPDYNAFTIDNDLGLIFMDQPIPMNGDNIDSIQLATSEPPVGDTVTAAGWGKTCDAISCGVSDPIMEVDVPVLSDDAASDYYGPSIDFSTKICIDAANGHGTCNGDSGGPLMDQSSPRMLVGITSFGSTAGCESGAPDCFTSVPSFRQWIIDNMQ